MKQYRNLGATGKPQDTSPNRWIFPVSPQKAEKVSSIRIFVRFPRAIYVQT